MSVERRAPGLSDLPLPAGILVLVLAVSVPGLGPVARPLWAQETPLDSVRFDLQAHRLGGMRAQVATLLVQGGRGGAIATEVLALPVGSAGEKPGQRLVPLLVEIEGPSLLGVRDEDSASTRQRIEIYAYALTPQGAVVDFLSQTVGLDLETLGERIYSCGLKFVGSLSLPPGEYSLRVLVLDVASGQYGLRTVPLTVPAAQSGGMLIAPLVPEPPGSWILVRQDVTSEVPSADVPSDETEETPSEAAPRTPPIPPEQAVRSLVLGRQLSLPSAFPLFDSDATVEVHLLAYALGNKPKISAKLTPQEGGEPRVIPVEVLARLGTDDPKMDRLTCRFSIPHLGTGAFLLSFEAKLPEATSETPQIRALVLEDNPLGEQLVWGQLRSAAARVQQTAQGGPTVRPQLDLPERRKKRVAALEQAARQGYARALSRVGSGATSEEVVDELAAFERELIAADPAEGVPALERGETGFADQLAQTQPEAMVPLMSFHLDLYLLYRREKDFALATHSRNQASTLALRYADAAATDSARTIASQALTSLGTEMLDAGLRNAGGSALEQALKLDDRNEAARLQLAAHYERLGNYPPAVDELRKLVQHDPKSAEGRLRLALNERRVGDTRRAEEELRRLISETNPPWTLTVAYTELANLYLDANRVSEAVTLLRQGLDRLPEQERLYIQLAFALDRQRRFIEARQILARMALRSDLIDGTASPRHRYAQGSAEGLAEARNRVVDAARTRQPLLIAALDHLARHR